MFLNKNFRNIEMKVTVTNEKSKCREKALALVVKKGGELITFVISSSIMKKIF